MTRDKAIELRMGAYSGNEEWRRKMAGRDVDDWSALGMLKLDQPGITPEKIFCEVLTSAGLGSLQQRAVVDGLYSAGLMITEKGNQNA
jgi:hypothetical protein